MTDSDPILGADRYHAEMTEALDLGQLSFLNSESQNAVRTELFGIPYLDLVGKETPYWGEIPQSSLREILEADDVERAFDETVRKLGKPHLSDYALNVGRRAAWLSVLPAAGGGPHPNPLPAGEGDRKDTVETHRCPRGGECALDVGAGFGANTLALAQSYAHVVATDIVPERLAFIGKRCRQRGIENVTLLRAPFETVPLAAAVADLVVCNGVLEWVGAWDAEGDPEEAQRAMLRRLSLTLKEDGLLYIGIENRFGLAAWRGAPDHSGLRFTSLPPRVIARLMVRAAARVRARKAQVGEYTVQQDYRTYTHSAHHWRRILNDCGYSSVRIWGANDYNYAQFAFPVDEPRAVEILATWKTAANRPRFLNRAIAKATFRLPHCLLMVASPRSSPPLEERIERTLESFGMAPSRVRVLAVDTRSHDQWIRRFVLEVDGQIQLLTAMPQQIAEQRSLERVRLTETGAHPEKPAIRTSEGISFLLEPFRREPSLLHAPIRGNAVARLLEQWSRDRLLHYFALESAGRAPVVERRFSTEDAERLIDCAPEPFDSIASLKERARRLIGATLRFGVAHGDLAPDNVFLDGADLVIEDWNETISDAPVALDLTFLAFTWAFVKGLRREGIRSALAALRRCLTPDEFAKRQELLCLALLHWRTLKEPKFWEEARRRVEVALSLQE